MKIYKSIGKMHILRLWLAVGSSLAVLLIFPKECRNGAANGAYLCIQVLIPSLFPFMVLSSFCVHSGITQRVPKIIVKTVYCIFRLPPPAVSAIALSLIGGYPVGAKVISELYQTKQLSESDAKRMALFCVASGPGFLVTYLGTVMMGSKELGYILLAAQTISVIILGTISGLGIRKDKTHSEINIVSTSVSIGESLIAAVKSGIHSCAGMCGMVVLFGSISEVISRLTVSLPHLLWISAATEITNGTKLLTEVGASPVLISAMCGFGGLCVHLQVFQILGKNRPKLLKFYLYRILQGALSSLVTYLLLRIFPRYSQVFSTITSVEPRLYKGIGGCIFLILSCVVFLASLRQRNKHTI